MNLSQAPQPLAELSANDSFPLDLLSKIGSATVAGQYIHWNKLRRLKPPAGVDHDTWWKAVKLSRHLQYRSLPLVSADGKPFVYMLPDSVLEGLHRIDSEAHSWLGASSATDLEDRDDRFIINSLIEEAVTSSQLEGAATTRAVAAKMIRSGRRPKDVDERMIVNNYQAIHRIRDTFKEEALTPEMLTALHRLLTAGTLDDPDAEGRFQHPEDERVCIVDRYGDTLHTPPPAEQLPDRLSALCRFANGDDAAFLHPVLRAIALHFMLAYEHPFLDGNGRTARALFYWAMLRAGYGVFQYISISRQLLTAPAQYGRAFLETETDGCDLTYFLVHQVEVLVGALDDLRSYLAKKIEETKAVERQLKQKGGLNHRQLALLAHALRHADAEYTVRSHRASHNIANATARADLLELVSRGFLERRRIGRRTNAFSPATDIHERIESKA